MVDDGLGIAVYVVLGVYWGIIISFIYMVRREWYRSWKADEEKENDGS